MRSETSILLIIYKASLGMVDRRDCQKSMICNFSGICQALKSKDSLLFLHLRHLDTRLHAHILRSSDFRANATIAANNRHTNWSLISCTCACGNYNLPKFLLTFIHMMILYQTAKFKPVNIFAVQSLPDLIPASIFGYNPIAKLTLYKCSIEKYSILWKYPTMPKAKGIAHLQVK